ncbi:MAG TPA: ATP-binding protein [Polyangiaceae bacterium]|nr:ATP-binding protein [Polyangiaceae bacterium]
MKLGLRGKIFLSAFALITACLAVVYVYARRETLRDTRERVRADLMVRLELVRLQVEEGALVPAEEKGWDAAADRLGQAAASRVTLLTMDGRVLGDSEVHEGSLERLENHLDRPEVREALERGVGSVERYSATARHPMVYAAAVLRREGKPFAIARVAFTTEQAEQAPESLEQALLQAVLLALAIASVLAFIASHLATRPISQLTRAASRMAAGDLEVRARVSASTEFMELAQALDRLATNLSSTLGDLRQERDRLRGILSSMDEGVLFLDDSRKVALVNPALRHMLLLSGDPTGRSLLEVVRHSELKELLDAARDEDEDEGGVVQGEIHVSGLKPRHLLVRARSLQGDERGVVAVFLDVTETRRLENLRREFVANVSHELRTPVTSIRSATETLENVLSQKPEFASRFLDIITRNAERLHALVEDLLDLSRIESRQFSLVLASLAPRSVMEHIAGLFAERAQRRAIELVVDVPLGLGELRADRRALEHVLSNLVDNAVKYAGEGRRVVLSGNRVEGMIELVVSDNGPGIEARHLPRLFERFYRVDAGRSRDLGGTGLGLSIVKHLVESMSGRVTVESEPGQGTTFRVKLPAAPGARGPASA